MELFDTGTHFIIQDGEHALWCNKETGVMEARYGYEISNFVDPTCLGVVHGVIGRLQVGTDAESNILLLIAKRTEVGILPGMHPIYRIDLVVFLPLCMSPTVPSNNMEGVPTVFTEQFDQQPPFDEAIREMLASNLQKCPYHGPRVSVPSEGASMSFPVVSATAAMASANANVFKRTVSNLLNANPVDSSSRFIKPESRQARRICENLDKLFNDSPSFYYSPTADITASTWRVSAGATAGAAKSSLVADDRFFWNRHCLLDLLSSSNPLSPRWIVPIIQGFVQFEKVSLPVSTPLGQPSPDAVVFQNHHSRANTITENDASFDEQGNHLPSNAMLYSSLPSIDLQMGIISRRSRHRAGTRYKKRGVDDLGYCANYVETEQILFWPPHWCSYVIVRGSVPLFWSQSGIQYRPPPKLEKTFSENAEAFGLHFERELVCYKHVNIVNLLQQSSKEEALTNAYTESILYYNSPSLTYVTFDFNEHCRGMRFENILVLTQNIENVIRDSTFTWIDCAGIICEQAAVFRVNCMDCLDRTNIAQAAISRVVLEWQCGKMGILPPDAALPNELLETFKTLWANNGDAISRQYAGTNALKGDYTRTGEHGLTSMVKDGVNSANRYYLNQFQDAGRQLAIDSCLGMQIERQSMNGSMSQSPSAQNLAGIFGSTDETGGNNESLETKCENLKTLMDDVRKMLLTDDDLYLGAWLLFDCSDPSASTDAEFDVILVLTVTTIFIVRLDQDGDPVFYYQLPLLAVEKVEFGLMPSSSSILSFAKKTKKAGAFKVTYRYDPNVDDPTHSATAHSVDGSKPSYATTRRSTSTDFFGFMLRPANFRLFSGVLIQVENSVDANEVLTMIAECFRNVTRLCNLAFKIEELGDQVLKVDRKKVPRIQNHPNKIMWADSAATFAPLTLQSPPNVDSRRNSMAYPAPMPEPVKEPVMLPVFTAPKRTLVDTFKSFSNLLKPSQRESGASTQDSLQTQPAMTKRDSKSKVSNNAEPALSVPRTSAVSTYFHLPLKSEGSTSSAQEGFQTTQQVSSSSLSSGNRRPAAGEEWKWEVVKQMTTCNTRIIQL